MLKPDVTPGACCLRAEQALRANLQFGRRLTDGHLQDLLTDLAHLAAREGWDFEAEARCAVRNHEEEA